MAKKNKGRSQKRRSERKVLDAFHLAERAAASASDDDDDGDTGDLRVHDGVMDARRFMKHPAASGSEDEELDSDEAMALDDDYDVLSTKFSQTVRDRQKRAAAADESASDGDDGYHSIDEAQLVPLSEAWAMDDRDLAAAARRRDVVLDDAWDTESLVSNNEDEDTGSESGSDTNSDSDSGAGSEDEDAMLRGAAGDAAVDLAATTRAIQRAVGELPKHTRLVAETTAENEHGVPTRGALLLMAAMVAAAPGAAPLVAPHEHPEGARPLAVPLPKHVQARNDRRVAYGITKQDVGRWQASVRALQDADHVTFPLPAPSHAEQADMDAASDNEDAVDAAARAEADAYAAVPAGPGHAALAAKVDGLLRAGALLDESNEATFEQLRAARLSPAELRARTHELRRMRELMFRDEQRAKRIKKIKSKQFRKLRKKDRARDAAMVEGEAAASGVDSDADAEDHDVRRAEERMSLRHKTQLKWARNLIKAGISKDASSRSELEEMLRAGERLRARQAGRGDALDSGLDAAVLDVERELAHKETASETAERGRLGKGVLAMDFMRAAEERQRREHARELAFVRSMDGLGLGDLVAAEPAQGNPGRRVYAPAALAAREAAEEAEDDVLRDFRDDEERSLVRQMGAAEPGSTPAEVSGETSGELTNEAAEPSKQRSPDTPSSGPPRKKHRLEQAAGDASDASDDAAANPWLAAAAPGKSHKYTAVTAESSRLEKAAHKIQKRGELGAGPGGKRRGTGTGETLVDLDRAMSVAGNVAGSEDEHDDGSSDTRMFRQQTLLREAFAGDDVVAEFRSEKRAVEDAEADREEDATLPGWGGWSGAGVTRKPRKKFVRKIDGVAQREDRKDRGLDNVIVNETVNKHNLKYQSLSVPFPYELREQYERALRMPVGEEWASRATHQKTILPRVIIKQGVAIDPMKAPFK